MDEKLTNEAIAEDMRADFYTFVADRNWEDARAVLASLEDMKVSTYELRREMNTAMDEPSEGDDFTNSNVENYGL